MWSRSVSPAESSTDDVTLARAAAAGDRAALEALLERHLDLVHAVCRRVIGDHHDALDAAQEALIRVTRNISKFDARARFTTWLYRIAVNASIDELRRRKRRPAVTDQEPDERVAGFEGAVDARIDVDAALSEVADDFRVAVVLRDLCDLEYEEIARVLDIPIGTVRSRIARGRAAVAAQLGNSMPAAERPTLREP